MRMMWWNRRTGKTGAALIRVAGLVFGLTALYACDSPTAPPPDTTVWDSTWPVWSAPEEAGFSTAALDQVASHVETLNTTGLVVVVGGQVLHWQGNVTEVSYVASVRKSILSILYGRHVADATIDFDATLEELGLDDEGGLMPIERQATIRHLLTARSGVYHPASNDGDDSSSAPARGSRQPGTYFLYNNWDFNAAGAVFELLTGRTIYDALRDDLAAPLGMEDFDREAQQKSGDLTVSRYPAYHMWLSTRDMARIGELMLREGRWNGAQLVPSEWVEMSTSAITPLEEMNPESRRNGSVGFGMMWWVWDGPAAVGAFAGALTAAGAYGQYITVLPALDMVVAHGRREWAETRRTDPVLRVPRDPGAVGGGGYGPDRPDILGGLVSSHPPTSASPIAIGRALARKRGPGGAVTPHSWYYGGLDSLTGRRQSTTPSKAATDRSSSRPTRGVESQGEVRGMKARAVVLIGMMALAAMPMTAQAQTKIGFRAGATTTKVSGDDLKEPSAQTGFTVGGFAHLRLTDRLAFELGAAFTRKGVKAASKDGSDASIDLDYVEIPLLGVFSIGTVGMSTPRFYAGFVLSFESRCEVTMEGILPLIADCHDPLFEGDLGTSPFDIGGLVGFGLSIDLGARTALDIDGMGNLGLTPIDEPREDAANRNRAFMVTAGLSFVVGG